MKNYKVINILLFLLFVMAFANQSAKATSVDIQPVYINGGSEGLFSDLYSQLSTASICQSDSINGKCFFTFIISKNGIIETETIKLACKTTLPEDYVNAAIEVIKRLGKFKPAMRYDAKEEKEIPLRVRYNISVLFPIPISNNMKVSIEKQSDGTYIAYNTDGDHCTLIGTGDSVKEAKEDFFNTIEETKESHVLLGDEMPKCLSEEIDFRFDISSLFEYYPMFNVSALGRYLGINPGLMRQYKKGDTPISDAQLEKIEAGINRLGIELAALRLV